MTLTALEREAVVLRARGAGRRARRVRGRDGASAAGAGAPSRGRGGVCSARLLARLRPDGTAPEAADDNVAEVADVEDDVAEVIDDAAEVVDEVPEVVDEVPEPSANATDAVDAAAALAAALDSLGQAHRRPFMHG